MVLFSTVQRFEPSKGFQYPSWLAVLSVLCPSSQAYCHARAAPSCSTPLPPLWCVLAANQSAVWLCLKRMFLGVRVVQESIINRSRWPQGTRCAGLLESSSSQTAHPTLVCVCVCVCACALWGVLAPQALRLCACDLSNAHLYEV